MLPYAPSAAVGLILNVFSYQELAVFEKMSDQVKISHEGKNLLVKDYGKRLTCISNR